MRRLRGVDVSVAQGSITDAIVDALVTSECSFAYIRGVSGNEKDPDSRMRLNAEVFRRHGIPVGFYFVTFPLPHLDPIAQAEHHVRIIESTAGPGELAPMIDAEWPPRETRLKDGTIEDTWGKWKCSEVQLREWLLEYADRLDDLSGSSCPFYDYRYHLQCIGAVKAPEFGQRPLVLADYTWSGRVPDDAACAALKVPAPWDRVTIWQHDGDGGLRLPGGADCDWNVMADPEDLNRLMARPEASIPPPPLDADGITLAHVMASAQIVEDSIAEYRRTRDDIPF